MNRPSTSSKPRRPWHRLIEHYTPDGVIGRFLFAAAMGPVVTFFLWLFGVGITNYGLFSLLLTIFAAVLCVGFTLLGLVVLWPVYLTLIGNLDSPEEYTNGGSTTSPELDGDRDDSIAVLKRQYAAGKISQEEFERRLDTLLDLEERTSSGSSNSARQDQIGVREFDHN